jgi:hypothetical protein
MQDKKIIAAISAYKIFINILRIFAGLIIIHFGSDIHRAIRFLTERDFMERNLILNFLAANIKDTSGILTLILALILIIFSVLELVFIFALIFRKRWGAIGLFATLIVWIFTELLFVSKFLALSKLVSIAVNLVILYLLYNLLKTHGHYFKK